MMFKGYLKTREQSQVKNCDKMLHNIFLEESKLKSVEMWKICGVFIWCRDKYLTALRMQQIDQNILMIVNSLEYSLASATSRQKEFIAFQMSTLFFPNRLNKI